MFENLFTFIYHVFVQLKKKWHVDLVNSHGEIILELEVNADHSQEIE